MYACSNISICIYTCKYCQSNTSYPDGVKGFSIQEIHFTAHKWSLGKVVFSQACVFTGGRVSRSLKRSHGRVPPPRHGTSIPYSSIPPTTDNWWSSLDTCPNLFTWGPTSHPPPPPVLTPSGGHRNTYSWQAGGTHPTGMLSWIVNEIKLVIYDPLVTKPTVVRDHTYITIGLNLFCNSKPLVSVVIFCDQSLVELDHGFNVMWRISYCKDQSGLW